MTSFKSQFLKIEKRLSPEYILKKNPAMLKKAQEIKRAVTRAGMAGAKEMRKVILNSPTGSPWHNRVNVWRAANKSSIMSKDGESVNNNSGSGARLDSGNMYNSVSYKRGKAIPDSDRRKRQGVTGGFGWPASQDGQIKDAPSSPLSRSRNPDPTEPGMKPWRNDPRYFVMQEYGFGSTPGMDSQRKASIEAEKVLKDELAKLGIK
jgi:hypothetical protein